MMPGMETSHRTTIADLKVGLYQRISEAKDELGVDRQRDLNQKWCADQGIASVDDYTDNNRPATAKLTVRGEQTAVRPDFARMIGDIQTGRINAVVFWRHDRLLRDDMDLNILRALSKLGLLRALIDSQTGTTVDLSTADGAFVAGLRTLLAMYEGNQKSERQIAANIQRAKLGRPSWTRTPFGYRKITDARGKLSAVKIDPAEGKIIRKAYRDVLAGRSLNTIANEWNASGIRTAHAGRKHKGGVASGDWHPSTLRDFLCNPRNAGLLYYRGEHIGTGDWPAIVDEQLWRGVVAKCAEPGRNKAATRTRTHLLSGIARCEKCGEPMYVLFSAKTGRPYYQCKKSGCYAIARDLQRTDDVVIENVVLRLSGDDARELLLNKEQPDLQAYAARKAELECSQEELSIDRYTKRILSASIFEARMSEIAAELDAITAATAHTGRAELFDGVPVGDCADAVERAFRGLPLDRQRAIVDALFTVTVRRGQRGNGPFKPELVDCDPQM
jgi:DNA invertase Pin-like site-specific DNA recombinase